MPDRPFVERLDTKTLSWVVSQWNRDVTLDAAMVVIGRWTPIMMIFLILLASINLGLTHPQGTGWAWAYRPLIAVTAAVISRLANEPMARVFRRLRPFEIYSFVPLLGHHRGNSFPSNHATGAFALAVSMLAVPGYGPLLLILGVLLCLSRIYTGLHHLSDVVAGAVIGTIWACICTAVFSAYIAPHLGAF